jgi:hypothetical protein
MTEQAGKGTCALDLGRYSLLVMLRTTRSIDEAEDLGGRYHQHFQIVLPPGFFRIVLTLIIELTHSGRIASQSFRSSLTKWKMTGLLYMVCAQTTVDVAGMPMTCAVLLSCYRVIGPKLFEGVQPPMAASGSLLFCISALKKRSSPQ